MSLSTVVKLALLSVITASAIPNNSPSPSCFTDTFENYDPSLVLDDPVGVNNGVTYAPWNAVRKNPVTGTTGGIIPHSGSIDIVTGVREDVLQLGSLTLNAYGNIYASPSKAFDLYSFWFGCAVDVQAGGNSAPQACVLSVIGFNVAGQQLPVATFSYAPTNPVAAPMVLAYLPNYYRGLKNVTIGVAASTTAPAVTTIWVDDVTHCNYS